MNNIRTSVSITVAVALIAVTSEVFAATPARSVHSNDARALVIRYFDALEQGRFRAACSLLGRDLLIESHGSGCPVFLRLGMPSRLEWELVATRPVKDGVGVLLRLGQDELDHVRMRTWLAVIRLEEGTLKLVETRLLR
jgi:hypothetical protein